MLTEPEPEPDPEPDPKLETAPLPWPLNGGPIAFNEPEALPYSPSVAVLPDDCSPLLPELPSPPEIKLTPPQF